MSENIDIQQLVKDRDKQTYRNKRFLMKMHKIHKILQSNKTDAEMVSMMKQVIYENTKMGKKS